MIDIPLLLSQCRKLRSREKYSEAIALLDAAIESVADARLFHLRGTCYEFLDEPFQARDDYSDAIELDNSNVEYYLERGCVYSFKLNHDEMAIKDFERVLELDPQNVMAHQQCCLCKILMGDLPGAMHNALESIRYAPNDDDSHFGLGQVYFGMKKYKEAAESFRRAASLDPNCAGNWSMLGSSLSNDEKHTEEVWAAYKQALALDDDNSSYYYNMASIEKKMGNNDNSLKYLQLAKAKMETNANTELLDKAQALLIKIMEDEISAGS